MSPTKSTKAELTQLKKLARKFINAVFNGNDPVETQLLGQELYIASKIPRKPK